MAASTFEFSGIAGESLSGTFSPAHPRVRGHALLAHCLDCGKDNRALEDLAHLLAASGFATLRIDYARGERRAPGYREDEVAAGDVLDIVAAGRAMEGAGMGPFLLVGHGLGGTAALLASQVLTGVSAVVTIGAPARVSHLMRPESASNGDVNELRSIFSGLPDGPADFELSTDRPLLIMHAPEDEQVPFDNALVLFDASPNPASLICLPGADHCLTKEADVEQAFAFIQAFSRGYFPLVGHFVEQPGAAVDDCNDNLMA